MTFHKDVKILLLTRSLRSFSTAILGVGFAIYLSKLGVTSVVMGLTFTGISLFSAIRSFVEGIVADRFGRKPLLLYSAGLMVLGGVIFSVTRNVVTLLISAVICGVGGMLAYTPAEQAMLTEKVSHEERTTAFSINSLLGTVGAVFGSFAGGLPELLQTMGAPELASYQPIFLLFAVTGMVTFVLFWLIEESKSNYSGMDDREDVDEVNQDERMLLVKWSGVVAVDIVGGSFIMNLMSYWFYLRFNVGPREIGAVFGASQVLAALSFILGLKMVRRVGTIKATVISRIPVVAVNILTPMMPSFTIVAILRIFMSLFSMIDVPLRQSYLMGVIKSRRRASAVGVVTVVSRVTSAGAPSLTGYIFEYLSYALPFFFAASFQLSSAALMYYLFKDIRPPEEKDSQRAR